MSDDDLDALLRAALPAHDVPAGRIAAVRSRARDELTRAHRNRRRVLRALEAGGTFALGAAQLAWAIVMFVNRPY